MIGIIPDRFTLVKKIDGGSYSKVFVCNYSTELLGVKEKKIKVGAVKISLVFETDRDLKYMLLKESCFGNYFDPCSISKYVLNHGILSNQRVTEKEECFATNVSESYKEVDISRELQCYHATLKANVHKYHFLFPVKGVDGRNEKFFLSFIVSKLYEGNLTSIVKDLSSPTKIKLMLDVFTTLKIYLEQANPTLMCDVSPRNILFEKTKNGYSFALTDFGLSSLISNVDMSKREEVCSKVISRNELISNHLQVLREFKTLLIDSEEEKDLSMLLEIIERKCSEVHELQSNIIQKKDQIEFVKSLYDECIIHLRCSIKKLVESGDPSFRELSRSHMIKYCGYDFYSLDTRVKILEAHYKKFLKLSPDSKNSLIMEKKDLIKVNRKLKFDIQLEKDEKNDLKKELSKLKHDLDQEKKFRKMIQRKLKKEKTKVKFFESQFLKFKNEMEERLHNTEKRLHDIEEWKKKEEGKKGRCPVCGKEE